MKLKDYFQVTQDADVDGAAFWWAVGIVAFMGLLIGVQVVDQVHDWMCVLFGWKEWGYEAATL